MPIKQTELEQLLCAAFPDASITIEDMAGDDDHYAAVIASPTFQGKTRLEQHRMVQQAVEGYDIHALSIRTSASNNSSS